MILIVDDKPENIFSLKKILEINDFTVDSAFSGEDALKKILKNDYSLIILDVQMPDMDGFEVAEAIRGYSKSKDIPIIFLSAVNTEKRFITKGYASGGIDYITKPVDPDILILKVKTLYKLYEQTRALNEAQLALRAEIEFRKQAQSELRERVQELRSILETIPHIAFTARADGQIEFVNQHWFDYSLSETAFPETHFDDLDLDESWKNAVASGSDLCVEVRLKKINSEDYRFHKLSVSAIRENNTIVKWVGTLTDIEDQKQAEKKKDEFLSIASHELKTPLTSIKAYFQLLERALQNQPITNIDTDKYLGRTRFQLDKLHNLITDLLDMSKIESGKLKFDKKNFDFAPLLESTVEMMRQTHSDYDIVFRKNQSATIFGDELRIEQVLVNYLTNAVKYSPDNRKVIIDSHVTDDAQLLVSVQDFGVGISAEKKDHIFSKFYRVEETSHKFQGLGIGLYICSEILKRHNASFGVDSVENEGSIFYFKIPLAKNMAANDSQACPS